MLSTTAIVRKATTNVTTPSESSIMNYRDSNEARLINIIPSGLLRSQKKDSQSPYRLGKDEKRITLLEPGTPL
jgi:hypothetical protein